MNKIRVNACEFIEDVRSGKSDGELMERFGLSVRSLPKVKQELVKRNLLSREEAGAMESTPVTPKIAIKAKEFLERFGSLPDDAALMDAYSITPTQLLLIYQTLIKKGLLSEYEYEHRAGKSPELEMISTPAREDSTSVTLKASISGNVFGHSETSANHSEFGRRTGPIGSSASNGDSEKTGVTHRMHPRHHEPEKCPKCGEPKHPSSPDECLLCGIIYSKYEQDPVLRGVAIWGEDHTVR